MKIYEIAFLAMACLMGLITFVVVIVLVKRVTREEQQSNDDSTPQTPAP